MTYLNAEERQKFRDIARGIPAFGEPDNLLGKKLAEYQKLHDQIRAELKQKIIELPDNPRVKRLSSGAMIVSSKDLVGQPWSAFYHDFEAQHKQLIELVEELTPQEFLVRIGTIIEKGRFWKPGGASLVFHPDVIEHLKNLE